MRSDATLKAFPAKSPRDAVASRALKDGARAVLPVFVSVMVFSFFINLLLFVSPLYMLQIYDRVIASRSRKHPSESIRAA